MVTDGSEEVGDRIADTHIRGGARGVHSLWQACEPGPHRVLGAGERRGAGKRTGQEPRPEALLQTEGNRDSTAGEYRCRSGHDQGEDDVAPAVLAQRAEEARPRLHSDGEDEDREAEGGSPGLVRETQVAEHQAHQQNARGDAHVYPADPQLADQVTEPDHQEGQEKRVLQEQTSEFDLHDVVKASPER